MISPRDIIKRMGVGGQLVPFFKCVCVYFAAGGGGPGARAAAAKCAPVLCLLLAVALHQHSLPHHQGRYARRVCLGLALSALGDALLVWPAQLVPGMAAFAAAHVAYLAAFGWRPLRPALGALAFGVALLYVRALGSTPGVLAALVPLYAAALAAMAWRAAVRGGAAGGGAALFALSDAVLGYEMFSGPVPCREVLVMSTYYLGQLGIAVSALRPPPAEHAA